MKSVYIQNGLDEGLLELSVSFLVKQCSATTIFIAMIDELILLLVAADWQFGHIVASTRHF